MKSEIPNTYCSDVSTIGRIESNPLDSGRSFPKWWSSQTHTDGHQSHESMLWEEDTKVNHRLSSEFGWEDSITTSLSVVWVIAVDITARTPLPDHSKALCVRGCHRWLCVRRRYLQTSQRSQGFGWLSFPGCRQSLQTRPTSCVVCWESLSGSGMKSTVLWSSDPLIRWS